MRDTIFLFQQNMSKKNKIPNIFYVLFLSVCLFSLPVGNKVNAQTGGFNFSSVTSQTGVEAPEIGLGGPASYQGTPFGGLIVTAISCTCSNNTLITVQDYYSRSIKNILVWPPISRLYMFFTFNPGQHTLGTYSNGGVCLIRVGKSCQQIQADGYINSGPGAGNSGPTGIFDLFGNLVKDLAGGLVQTAVKTAANMAVALGQTAANALTQAGIQLVQSELQQILRPNQELSYRGGQQSPGVRGEAKNYYIADEAKFSGNTTSPILDRNGNVIAQADSQFVNGGEKGTLKYEKTGVLDDGTVVVYDTTIDGIPRHFVQQNGVGFGANGTSLQVFRSIAVDPDTIPLGTFVEIPETRGMILPDGTAHNGIWRADDIGKNLKGFEVSLFIGTEGNRVFLKAAGISNQERLSIIVLQ